MHARFAPSSAGMWGNCSGALAASINAPSISNARTELGNAAHWLIEHVIEAFQGKNQDPITCSAYLGQQAPNGVVIDDEIVEGAQVMIDDVMRVAQKFGALSQVQVEQRVEMPEIHEDCWGTPDVFLILPEHSVIYVWDYKHGHRQVVAQDNKQLLTYLKGVCNQYGLDGQGEQQWAAVLRIVQPFCYQKSGPVDSWVVETVADLRAEWNHLHNMARAADTDPKMTTGKHCRDCPAVGRCSAARQACYSVMSYAAEPYEIDGMNSDELATERQLLSDGMTIMKARAEAIEDDIINRISNGDTATGLSIETAYGRETYTVEPSQVIALAQQFGFDASRPAVKTPRQATAACPKEMRPAFAEVIKAITHKPAKGFKLVKSSESKTARAFKKR